MSGPAAGEGSSPLDGRLAETMVSEGGRSAQPLEAPPGRRPSILPSPRRREACVRLSIAVAAAFVAYQAIRRLH